MIKTEAFFSPIIKPNKIPNAIFINEVIGLYLIGFAVFGADFGIGKVNILLLFNGLSDGVEFFLFVADIFVLKAFYGDALLEFFLEKASVYFWEEFLYAGKTCNAFDLFLI